MARSHESKPFQSDMSISTPRTEFIKNCPAAMIPFIETATVIAKIAISSRRRVVSTVVNAIYIKHAESHKRTVYSVENLLREINSPAVIRTKIINKGFCIEPVRIPFFESAPSRSAEMSAKREKTGAAYSGTRRVREIYITVRIHGFFIRRYCFLT